VKRGADLSLQGPDFFSQQKKNLPSLRTRTGLRGSNEEGQLVPHIAVGRFDAVVHERTVLRGWHDKQVRREGQAGRAVLQKITRATNENHGSESDKGWRSKTLAVWEGEGAT